MTLSSNCLKFSKNRKNKNDNSQRSNKMFKTLRKNFLTSFKCFFLKIHFFLLSGRFDLFFIIVSNRISYKYNLEFFTKNSKRNNLHKRKFIFMRIVLSQCDAYSNIFSLTFQPKNSILEKLFFLKKKPKLIFGIIGFKSKSTCPTISHIN